MSEDDAPPKTKRDSRLGWFVLVIAILAFVVHVALRHGAGNAWWVANTSAGLDWIAVALLAAASLPWWAPRLVDYVESVGVGGVNVKLRQQMQQQQEEIDGLGLVLASLLTKFEQLWLLNLADHARFAVTERFRQEFTSEMRHLMALGFIEVRMTDPTRTASEQTRTTSEQRAVFEEMYRQLGEEKKKARVIRDFRVQLERAANIPGQPAQDMPPAVPEDSDIDVNVHNYFQIAPSGLKYIELRKQRELPVDRVKLQKGVDEGEAPHVPMAMPDARSVAS